MKMPALSFSRGGATMIRSFLSALCAVAFLVKATGTVVADEAAMKKYRNYLPEQILALPEKVRQSEMQVLVCRTDSHNRH
jgi:hypothetical protein